MTFHPPETMTGGIALATGGYLTTSAITESTMIPLGVFATLVVTTAVLASKAARRDEQYRMRLESLERQSREIRRLIEGHLRGGSDRDQGDG